MIRLTLWQRINLETLIQAQKMAFGEDYILAVEIWKKISVPDAVRQEYLINPCGACGTPQRFDMDAVRSAEPIDVEFNGPEARRILKYINDCKTFSVANDEWLTPLEAGISEIIKAAGGPEPVKSASAAHKGRR